MDETSYRVLKSAKRIYVKFDLREEQSSFAELSFSAKDALAVINMVTLRKETIPLRSMKGMATMAASSTRPIHICLTFKSGFDGSRCVTYPYEKLTKILNEALMKL